ncbi:hypothetical protein [Spiroplasma attinicola]|uniref:hypothetical protein n=1 Tax=Spiroplasma attinicola TaxID=2904537 RepID=UPI0020229C99|nr:hypothetical protein [Spiroplasma sp. JKS002670]MCL8209638.1 hypothetical protein [Spiroplasma sp. JKS002670]
MENNKNFLESEKQKKPLYKSWKLYAVALMVIGIGLGVGLGVGLNTSHNSITPTPIQQINLNDLSDLVTEVASDTTEENALTAFLEQNKEKYSDLQNNVTFKAGSFNASDYDKLGSYTIVANATGKYTGEVNVTISTIIPKDADEAVDVINQFIHQDIPIDGPGQTVLFTAEEWTSISNSLNQQKALLDALSDKAFSLLKAFNPNFAKNIEKFTITGQPSDWNNNVDRYRYPDYKSVAEKLDNGELWAPETMQFNGKDVPLLTVGFQVTLKDGTTSAEPLVGDKNAESDGKGHYSGNKDGEYKNSFGVIWNLNIKIGIEN